MTRPCLWLVVTAAIYGSPVEAAAFYGGVPQTSPASTKIDPPVEDTVIEFGTARYRMTVPVTIGDAGPFHFVVDTGAERSVVSQELAALLALGAGAATRLVDFAGVGDVDTVKVPSITAGRLGTGALEAPMLPRENLGAAGMLGIDALQGHEIIIDFNRDRMNVRPSKRRTRGEIVVEAENRLGQLIVTDAKFNDQQIAVIVDTGSWISVGNKAMLALAETTPSSYGPVTIRSVTGRQFTADLSTIDNVWIGGARFDNFGVVFADAPPFREFGLEDTPALILGVSSLRLFRRVEIDFANREIAFTMPRPRIDFHSVCRSFSNCKSY